MFSKKITDFRIRPRITARLNGEDDQRWALVNNGWRNTVIKFLAPALVLLPLLSGVPTEAATAAPLGGPVIPPRTSSLGQIPARPSSPSSSMAPIQPGTSGMARTPP